MADKIAQFLENIGLRKRSEKQSLAPQPIAPPETDENSPLEVNRRKVADLTRNLFMEIDLQVSERVGLPNSTSILEEVYKGSSRRVNGSIDTAQISNELKPYITDGLRFVFDDYKSGFNYTIDCSQNGFYPTASANINGESVKFEVHTGHSKNKFDRVSIKRSKRDLSGLQSERTVSTFYHSIGYNEDDYPLYITQRTMPEKHTSVAYDGIDMEGNVEIKDRQRISVDSGVANPSGIYSKKDKQIKWDAGRAPFPKVTVNEDQNEIQIDGLSFPIKTNIYDEIRGAVGNKIRLPSSID